jgi:rubredoxin
VPTLFVKCRTCGHEFPTPIGESATGRSGVIISGLVLRCPKCGADHPYSTSDFHIPSGISGPPSGGRNTAEPDLAGEHEAKQEASQEKLAGYGVVPPEDRAPPKG